MPLPARLQAAQAQRKNGGGWGGGRRDIDFLEWGHVRRFPRKLVPPLVFNHPRHQGSTAIFGASWGNLDRRFSLCGSSLTADDMVRGQSLRRLDGRLTIGADRTDWRNFWRRQSGRCRAGSWRQPLRLSGGKFRSRFSQTCWLRLRARRLRRGDSFFDWLGCSRRHKLRLGRHIRLDWALWNFWLFWVPPASPLCSSPDRPAVACCFW